MPGTIELPTPETVREAQAALGELAPEKAPKPVARIGVREGGGNRSVVVPRQAFELFLEVLGQLANGNGVTIIPVQAELTTQQAADLLNVSRPHLIGLLEAGKIPFRRVGSHRRVSARDLLAYKKLDDAQRAEAAAELTAEAQRLGLGY